MRAWLVCGVVAATTTFAHADAKQATSEIAAAIRANVENIGGDQDAAVKVLAKDAWQFCAPGDDFSFQQWGAGGGVYSSFFGTYAGGITVKLQSTTIGVDAAHDVAWFHAVAKVTVEPYMGEGKPTYTSIRIDGIAVHDKSWKLAAAAYSMPEPDKQLLAQDKPVPSGAPKTAGDAELAKAAATWIAGGFARARAAGDKLAANGTAPDEVQTGARTSRLLGGWDKLGLVATSIEARTFGGGALGFVRADVAMPIKNTKHAAIMTLAAVAVRDKAEWRWVALNFGPQR